MNLSNSETVKNLEVGDTIYNRENLYKLGKVIHEGTAFEVTKLADEYILVDSVHGEGKIDLQEQGIHFTTKEPDKL